MNDIVPDLLQKIEEDFAKRLASSNKLKDIIAIVEKSDATFADAYDYALEVGRLLAQVYQSNLSSAVLPEGKMYYNIAERILNPTMKKDFEMISKVAVDIEELLNAQAKIGIKAQVPIINQDRIDGLVNKISHADNFDDVKWTLDEPIVNFSESIVDDTIRANAEFHYQSGLNPHITRLADFDCCKWCNDIAGQYEYPDVPEDVYRRHERCQCTVSYYPGDGKVQDVHSKEWL